MTMLANKAAPPGDAEIADAIKRLEPRLRGARTKLLLQKPEWAFFGYMAMHLELQPVAGLGTCATDGENFLFDPLVLDKEPDDWQIFNWAHEIMHLFGVDLSRKPKDDIMVTPPGGSQPFSLWNYACDLWNNLKLDECGITVPGICPIDKKYKGWSKDQIYEDLKKNVKGGGGGVRGRTCGGFCGKPGSGKKGGKKADPNAPAKAPVGKGDLEGWKPGKSEEAKWTSLAKEGVEHAKAKGKAPGFAESQVQKLLESRVPWREILWPFVVRAGKEWRYRPPSRTGAARGMILPRLCPEDEIEHGVFVFDTSGSIDDVMLQEFCTEIETILKTIRMRVTVLMVDAAVHAAYEFEPGEFDYRALRWLGRGGTAFEPAFRWVEEQGVTPTMLVYFTDTMGSFPKAPPEYPVLWASIDPNGKVPWGEYLSLKEETI
jgi:predicted metal-dependent peptidase